MDHLDTFEHFVVAEWRNSYADRHELEVAFGPLLGGDLKKDAYEGFDVDEYVRQNPGLRPHDKAPSYTKLDGLDRGSAVRRVEPNREATKLKSTSQNRPPTPDGVHRTSSRGSISEMIPLLRFWKPDVEEEGGRDVCNHALVVFVKNVERVAYFYQSHLHEFEENLELLRQSVAKRSRQGRHLHSAGTPASQHSPDIEGLSIQRAYVDLYRHSKFLEAYAGLNYTLLMSFSRPVSFVLTEYLERKEFCQMERLRDLINAEELTYAESFHSLNLTEARTALLLKQTQIFSVEKSQFGFYIGVCTTLTVWLLWDVTIDNARLWQDGTIFSTAAFPLFRGISSFIMVQWAWAISCYVWSRYRINYIYMFQLDPGILPNVEESFADAAKGSVVFFVCILLYFKTVIGTFPQWFKPGIYPLILVCYILSKLTFSSNPFLIYTAKVVASTFAAPFTEVSFFSIFIGDWLTSLGRPGVDMAYAVCYFTSGVFLSEESGEVLATTFANPCHDSEVSKYIIYPIICGLPLWLRFLQCLKRTYESGERYPNLLNAVKYSLAMIVVFLGAFHGFDRTSRSHLFAAVWILLFAVSGFFSFIWDVLIDWGLGRPECGFLSDKLLYGRREYYYLAIVTDFFLRFSWLLTLVGAGNAKYLGLSFLPEGNAVVLLQTVIEIAEVFRRTMWGFFRLENEHLRNTLHFRDSNFIPLHFDQVYNCDKKLTESQDSSTGGGVPALELITLAILVIIFSAVVISSRFIAGI
uniref:EXS domain-containing protein n=1 Tax=Rhodosorus marinus TaxID=101924 RepID=A0A7S3EQK1_9RHOD|mmetsp:Transcript_8692/g.38675  ORF Transcript_8692/g.38675 Transcript_8692/m.38675 type:complete len:750 (+) Transcript_8692:357-2606(+)|eukprot:CAMPEP_0113962248 /NCGR_PEP_ID=MMETSP0011_2-20120614/5803_1 /TAXON_ID=101924 /ORGANISM="Rhodosorus marinus" /LENGTH=749 /DNA_ID=CAMNT_0000974067 /DNA_START=232 /DNA_END=2481 /DNA_ORIENTATION=- /assembly_acc=CAM_ASM_000156